MPDQDPALLLAAADFTALQVPAGIGFVALLATYAWRTIVRSDKKSDQADAAREAENDRLRVEVRFWRSIAMTGKPPDDAPDDLHDLYPREDYPE